MKRCLVLLLSMLALTAGAKTLYVSAARPNNNGNGLSWGTAKKTIQAAVNTAKAGDTILVNDGTYFGFETGNRAITIKSVNGASKTFVVADPNRFGKSRKYVVGLASSTKKYHDCFRYISDSNGRYGYGYWHWDSDTWDCDGKSVVEPQTTSMGYRRIILGNLRS